MIRIKIREAAESQGMNMQALAEKSGIAYSTVVDLWYDRSRRIDKRTIHRICRALNVKPGDIIVDDGEENRTPILAAA